MTDFASRTRATIFDGFLFAYAAAFFTILILNPDQETILSKMNVNIGYFLAGMSAGGILSLVLFRLGIQTLGEVLYAPAHRRFRQNAPAPLHRTLWGIQLFSALLITFVTGIILTEINPIRLVEAESVQAAMRLFGELSSPDWSILPKAVLKIIDSIFIAFMSTAIALPIAFCLSFLAARNILGKTKLGMLFLTVLRLAFNVTRSVEPVLWAIIFSVWVSFGPFAGMLALCIHSVASLSKQFSEIVEGVENGPIEGIEATGANGLQVVWFAVVPQITLPYVSYTIDRWDINVRMATILGFVGGGGIGTMLMEYQGQSRWPQVGCIIIVIALVVWVMDAFSSHVRNAIK